MVKRGKIDAASDTRPYYQKLYERAKKLGNFRKREIECWMPQEMGKIVLYHVDGRKLLYVEKNDILVDLQDPWKEATSKRVRRCSIHIFKENAINQIREQMEILEITNYQLAKLTGIDKGTISRYISGKQKPRIDAGQKICEVLHLQLHDLYDELDEFGNCKAYHDYGDDDGDEDENEEEEYL